MASDDINSDDLKRKNKDINEVFYDIAEAEQRVADEGFQEGFSSGCKNGQIEGFHLGYHRGAELGAELGYYKGVIEAWIAVGNRKKSSVSEKAKTQLHKLYQTLENFPHTNTENDDILALADSVRATYKKVCSLLNFNGNYPEATKLTF